MLKNAKSVVIPTLLVMAFLLLEKDGVVPEPLITVLTVYITVCGSLRLIQMLTMTRDGFIASVMHHKDGQLLRLMSIWQPRFSEVIAIGSLFIVLYAADLQAHAVAFAMSEIVAPMAVANTARRAIGGGRNG